MLAKTIRGTYYSSIETLTLNSKKKMLKKIYLVVSLFTSNLFIFQYHHSIGMKHIWFLVFSLLSWTWFSFPVMQEYQLDLHVISELLMNHDLVPDFFFFFFPETYDSSSLT